MHPATAIIDLDALRYNYGYARRLAGRRVMAVLKANAYGHGAVVCAQALCALADGFAVASIDEALELRHAGIQLPILLLEGFFDAAELPEIARYDLWTVIASPWQVDAIAAYHSPSPLHVWLKLDSGMHRLGLPIAAFRHAWLRLRGLSQIASLRLMTHLARADELDAGRTDEQAVTFALACRGMAGETSISNSAGVLGWPALRADWARPGLMLYGISPFKQPHPVAAPLRPVMRLQSRIFAIHSLSVGEPIGYGGEFVTQRASRIGVVAIGYADGYPQFAPSHTCVWVDGHSCPLVGRVSMDMLTIDVTDHPTAHIGSIVCLWGQMPSVEAVAQACSSSAYALLAGIKRVRRDYIGSSDRAPLPAIDPDQDGP